MLKQESMEKFSMIQGSEEWHKWRREGIGSSDVSAILGLCPYNTPLNVYESKVFDDRNSDSNPAIEKGHDLEPRARAALEIQKEKNFLPTVLQHESLPFLRCSLDGMSEDGKEICEIKYVGKDHYKKIKAGEISEHHMVQMQYQLFLSGAEKCHYVAYYKPAPKSKDKEEIHILEVEPDLDQIEIIFKEVKSFWNESVLKRNPPALSERDCLEVLDKDLLDDMKEYRKTALEIKNLESTLKEIKDRIEEKVPHDNCRGAGIHVRKYTRKGNVDYSKIPNLEGVNLDDYRKRDTTVCTIRIDKD